MDGMYSLYAKLISTENKSLVQVREDINLLLELLHDSRSELSHYYSGAALEQHNIINKVFEKRGKMLLTEVNRLAQWLDVELQNLLTHDELRHFASRLFSQLKMLVSRWEKGEERNT